MTDNKKIRSTLSKKVKKTNKKICENLMKFIDILMILIYY